LNEKIARTKEEERGQRRTTNDDDASERNDGKRETKVKNKQTKATMSNVLTGCCGGVRAGHSAAPQQISQDSIKSLFQTQSSFLDQFFETLDFEETAKFCQKVLDCKGTTLFTGIGKSSYIAK
jgi:DNA-binding MurR/RpiR family transcriptional regulator